MSIDEARLVELSEAAQDLHSDAMRITNDALAECVEVGRESRGRPQEASPERRRLMTRSLFAAGAVGAGVGSLFLRNAITTVFADSSSDVAMLQTAASIENLAIAVYNKALTLPASVNGAGNPVIAAFVTTTIKQHTDHLAAFNAAAMALGGQAQTKIDQPVYDAVVTPALGGIKGPGDVVGLALTLEDAAAQTYVKFGGAVGDANALKPFATIAPVEAQHAAVLRAVKALLDAGAPQLIALPPDLTALPAAAGDIAFKQASFYPTSGARPANEGAVTAAAPSAS